ncbi:hypothetical protein GCM10027058_20360 [Microbacterium neimengense]
MRGRVGGAQTPVGVEDRDPGVEVVEQSVFDGETPACRCAHRGLSPLSHSARRRGWVVIGDGKVLTRNLQENMRGYLRGRPADEGAPDSDAPASRRSSGSNH